MALREHVTLYRRLIAARARGQMQYRFSFAVLVIGNVAATLVDFIAVVVLFSRVTSLAGWSLAEVALMYGLALACFGLAEIFSPGFDLFSRQIVQGTFDRVLTRPHGAFFQILASDVALRKTGRVAQGLIIFAIAQSVVPVHWSPDRLLAVLLAIPSGSAMFFAVFVLGAASSFWTVQANEAVNIFTNGGLTMMNSPLEIYHVWLQRFVTFVVPLAFVSYYPTLFILGRADPLGLPPWIGLLSPLAATSFAVVAMVIWSIGVRHYTSVGS